MINENNKRKDIGLNMDDISSNWKEDVYNLIIKMNKRYFSLDDLYQFVDELKARHPENAHVKDKIRQILQYLRDEGYIKFVDENGEYELITYSEDESLSELFQNVLDSYIDGSGRVSKESESHILLTKRIPTVLYNKLQSLHRDDLIIKGSDGQGNKTPYPWVSILNKNITNSTQSGIYLVYLFKKDMSGFYIALDQGITNFKNLFGDKKFETAYEVSEYFRTQLSDVTMINKEINLTDGDNDEKGRGYEQAAITSKYYPSGEFNDDVMMSDLMEMLDTYDYVYDHIVGNSYDEVIKNALDDESEETLMKGEEAVTEIENTINPDHEVPYGINPKLELVVPQPRERKKFEKIVNPVLRKTDYLKKQTKDIKNGLKGEKFVLDYEMDKLRKLGFPDQADLVEWAAKESDTYGYDIKSYDVLEDGTIIPLFIEVKSTSNKSDCDFFVSKNEVEASEKYSQNYCLYRLYAIDTVSPKFYKAYGSIKDNFILDPVTYSARYKYPDNK